MSGLIPKQFITDLVDRADVVEVVGRRVQLKKAGKEFKACCPFHDEKHRRLRCRRRKVFTIALVAVSYTHLTLPTNREV